MIAALAAIYVGLAHPPGSPALALKPGDAVGGAHGRGGGRGGGGGGAMVWSATTSAAHELQRSFTGVMRSDVTCLRCRGKSTKFEDFQVGAHPACASPCANSDRF